MKPYKPRRANKRWLDEDCPDGVLAIFDSPKFADRYTVFYTEATDYGAQGIWMDYRSMSENPYHPQGVGLYCQMQAHQVAAYRYSNRHRACKWSSLPEKVKQCVRQDLTADS